MEAIVHIQSPRELDIIIKTVNLPILVMFSTPSCIKTTDFIRGFQAAAVTLRHKAVLAAMDVNKPENSPVSQKYNITGFPTLLFFDGGELQYPYPGGNNKEVFIDSFVQRDPAHEYFIVSGYSKLHSRSKA